MTALMAVFSQGRNSEVQSRDMEGLGVVSGAVST